MQECYSLDLVKKGDDTDFLKALKIYDQVTPVEIKTDPNDLLFWIDKDSNNFKIHIFKIFCNNILIGMAMTTYLVSSKVMILEYIAVERNYRKNVVYLSCINLLGQYFNKEKNYSINYWLTDINNKNNGQETDSESKMLTTILDIEGYKKIDAKFITPQLGITDTPGFEAYFMIKTIDNIQSISKSIYRGIIKSIYYEYYLPWYKALLNTQNFQFYEKNLNDTYNHLENELIQINDPIKVIDTGYKVISESTGSTPISKFNLYSFQIKNIISYLTTAILAVVIGSIIGLITITYIFPKIDDKGNIVAAIIGLCSTIPLVGLFKDKKSRK